MPVDVNLLGRVEDGLFVLNEPRRGYERIDLNVQQTAEIAKYGYRKVQSSFIVGLKRLDDDLGIVFKNGSQYRYNGVGKLIDKMFQANSKGKYFWRHIRDKVGFTKLSKRIDLDITTESDKRMFSDVAVNNIKKINKVVNKDVTSSLVKVAGLDYLKLDIGGIIMYQAIKMKN